MPERSNISPTAFDGEAAWSALPAHVQARIGAFALELGIAHAISEHAEYPASRAGERAIEAVGYLLREAVVGYDGVPEAAWWEGALHEPGTFRLPACAGMVCRQCGCSHNDPCDEGCGWHADGLCTACAGEEPDAGVEAAAVPKLHEIEARAVVKGACRAVSGSSLAEPVQPVEPMGSHLRRLAEAIGGGDEGESNAV